MYVIEKTHEYLCGSSGLSFTSSAPACIASILRLSNDFWLPTFLSRSATYINTINVFLSVNKLEGSHFSKGELCSSNWCHCDGRKATCSQNTILYESYGVSLLVIEELMAVLLPHYSTLKSRVFLNSLYVGLCWEWQSNFLTKIWEKLPSCRTELLCFLIRLTY